MRRVAILQARMTSTRLPGKVLMDLAGRPMLSRQIDRLRRSQTLDEIVIATTTNLTDGPVVEWAQANHVVCFRGSESDVLSRYVGAARHARAEVVVRVTGDCPLIDPEILDEVVRALETSDPACDYASNVIDRTYPRGLDTEALYADVLFRVDRLARSAPAREHVTYFIHGERRDLFLLRSVKAADDNSDLRWTVDTPEDLATIRRIYLEAGLADRPLAYPELVRWVRSRPDIARSNANVEQKST
jgi:spore coat polysaccharide biosynthesis protein SpsF